jgi:eukaryotic-like serine/threonine-protein kinase
MGVVWAARHILTKRAVALKLLPAEKADDAPARARLLREARAACAIDHPNVLPITDVIDADGAPALVMDLLEGESLRERLDRGPLSAREACALMAPVASALAAAHAANVVHRDVKPENVFLVSRPDGSTDVKVLDFGVAKLLGTEAGASALTETGAMLGTPYYMAPEQAFGERDIGAAVDAWALGVVLYECVAGERPTQAENLGQVIKRITQLPIAPLGEVVPDVPSELVALVGRLLERDPSLRLHDMTIVAESLARIARAGTQPSRKLPVRLLALGVALAFAAAGLARLSVRGSAPPTHEPTPIAAVPSGATLTETVPSANASLVPSTVREEIPPLGPSTSPASPPALSARSRAVQTPPARAPAVTALEDAGAPGPGRVIFTAPF